MKAFDDDDVLAAARGIPLGMSKAKPAGRLGILCLFVVCVCNTHDPQLCSCERSVYAFIQHVFLLLSQVLVGALFVHRPCVRL